jgi:hypothetical protein
MPESKSTFISYSSDDAKTAFEICRLLESRAIACWIAPRDIIPSHEFADEIVRGIESSASMVVLVSSRSNISPYVLREVEQAVKKGKAVFPVLIEEVQLTKALDFYIAPIHWINATAGTLDQSAETISAAVQGRPGWQQSALAPSWKRKLRYRRDAFVSTALATLLVLCITGAAFFFWLNRSLDMDFRRLGFVALSATRDADQTAMKVQAQVRLLASGVRFGDARLLTAAQRSDGGMERAERSPWPIPEQVGSMEMLEFPLPMDTKRLVTCLVVPSPGLHARYRVTQQFTVRPSAAGEGYQMLISPVADEKVSREDGGPCQAPD